MVEELNSPYYMLNIKLIKKVAVHNINVSQGLSMKELLVLLCLVSGSLGRHLHGWGDKGDNQCDAGEEEHHTAGQKSRLDDLRQSLANFKENVQGRIAKGKEYEADIQKLKKRIVHLEPSGCDDAFELQCGGERPQCLSRLLVCDGSVDCHSGLDEKECDTYTPSGSVWIGTFIYDHCTQRRPDKIKLTIENYKIIDHLKSFPEVTAYLEFDPDDPHADDTVLTMHGHMDLMPGDHVLRFEAAERDGLAFVCIFDGIHADHCHGEIVREIESDICAEFLLERR